MSEKWRLVTNCQNKFHMVHVDAGKKPDVNIFTETFWEELKWRVKIMLIWSKSN